jgi:hypothetical protein
MTMPCDQELAFWATLRECSRRASGQVKDAKTHQAYLHVVEHASAQVERRLNMARNQPRPDKDGPNAA